MPKIPGFFDDTQESALLSQSIALRTTRSPVFPKNKTIRLSIIPFPHLGEYRLCHSWRARPLSFVKSFDSQKLCRDVQEGQCVNAVQRNVFLVFRLPLLNRVE